MWTFDRIVEIERDVAGKHRARVLLRDDATGEERCEFLKFHSSPSPAELREARVALVQRMRQQQTDEAAERAREADPNGDRLSLTAAQRTQLRTLLSAAGVTHLKLESGRVIDLNRA